MDLSLPPVAIGTPAIATASETATAGPTTPASDSTSTHTTPLHQAAAYSEIYVGPTCHVQTAENRFGSHILEDLKSYVFDDPYANNGMDLDDDDEEEDEDDDEEDDDEDDDVGYDFIDDGFDAVDDLADLSQPIFWVDLLEGMDVPQAADMHGNWFYPNHETDTPVSWGAPTTNSPQHHQQQGFPRVARLRCNLTALSQRYNLYFAAYQDKIYVYQPKKAPQILPPPSLILNPRQTKAAKLIGGALDRHFPHQMNSIMVGNLGIHEVVLFAYDDGDVGAYYTHTIARYIRAISEQHRGRRGSMTFRPAVPKECFHANVGLSAWGLAIHEQSRLIAVSSNRHEVHVFAFAINTPPGRGKPTPRRESESPLVDDSPKVPSGQTALELEKHLKERTRTWRIVLPLGPNGHNIPTISFADDEFGNADKVIAVDVDGNTWFLDIWKIGAFPVLYPSTPLRGFPTQRYSGWGVLVLSDSHFKPTKNLREALGLPPNEIIVGRSAPAPETITWLDTTCSLWYVKEFAPRLDDFFRNRNWNLYHKTHAGISKGEDFPQGSRVHPAGLLDEDDNDDDDDDDDDNIIDPWEDASESESDSFARDESFPRISSDRRWNHLSTFPGPEGSQLKDIGNTVQLARAIVPGLGQTPPLDGSMPKFMDFISTSALRQSKTRPVRYWKTEFSPHMTKNLTILRTTGTDIELQPFNPMGTGVMCKNVLGHHNHHRRRVEPYDLARINSERACMVQHVPELNLVVVGSRNGRVALLTLTKSVRRVDASTLRYGFRVDRVLPRKADEDRRLRPWCALHGIAMSPVPEPRAKGVELFARGGGRRSSVLPAAQYRLILHYMDHTILMYDIARRADDEDLLIF